MTHYEEIVEKLKVFNKYEFIEKGHYYLCNGKRVGISVTRLIEEYTNEFDRDNIAAMVAARDGKTVVEVLKEWQYKNDFSKVKGSTCHEYAQSLWSGEKYTPLLFDGSDEYIEAIVKIREQADNFYNDFKDKYIHIKDEQIVGLEEYDIASAIDHLFYNIEEDCLDLIDYKTNSTLKGYNDDEKNRRYDKNMKCPLQHIKDNTLNHYYIQLSIYKFILEKLGIKVKNMKIVYFSENIDNYELIDIPYLKNEVIMILENRRVKNMNSVPVLLLGASGTGKSTSLRNFKKDEIAVVNVLGKPLPFRSDIKAPKLDKYDEIIKAITGTKKKTIVIDDAGYLITNEFMENASVKGYDKYNVMANGFFDFINKIKNIKGNKTVYLIMHEDTNENGDIRPKTIGKLLDDKVNIQGMFTVCIRSIYDNGDYKFRLKTNGQDCVKTPFGMFETNEMENDLKEFDKVVREYYDLDKEEESEEK